MAAISEEDPIRNVRAFLVGVDYRTRGDHLFSPAQFFDPLPLAWAVEGVDQAWDGVELTPGVDRFVDVVSFSEQSDKMQVHVHRTPFTAVDTFKQFGDFRFAIVVSADGVPPIAVSIELSWDGRWDQVKAYVPRVAAG